MKVHRSPEFSGDSLSYHYRHRALFVWLPPAIPPELASTVICRSWRSIERCPMSDTVKFGFNGFFHSFEIGTDWHMGFCRPAREQRFETQKEGKGVLNAFITPPCPPIGWM